MAVLLEYKDAIKHYRSIADDSVVVGEVVIKETGVADIYT